MEGEFLPGSTVLYRADKPVSPANRDITWCYRLNTEHSEQKHRWSLSNSELFRTD